MPAHPASNLVRCQALASASFCSSSSGLHSATMAEGAIGGESKRLAFLSSQPRASLLKAASSGESKGSISLRLLLATLCQAAAAQVKPRSCAQRASSWRLDSCSLRSTADTWVSTVFTEM